jgi:hypothetical protein
MAFFVNSIIKLASSIASNVGNAFINIGKAQWGSLKDKYDQVVTCITQGCDENQRRILDSITVLDFTTNETTNPSLNKDITKYFKLNIWGGGPLLSGSIIYLTLWNNPRKYVAVENNTIKIIDLDTINTSLLDIYLFENNKMLSSTMKKFFFRVYAKYENNNVIQEGKIIPPSGFIGLESLSSNNFLSSDLSFNVRYNKWNIIVKYFRDKNTKTIDNNSYVYIKTSYSNIIKNTIWVNKNTNIVYMDIDKIDSISENFNNPYLIVPVSEYIRYLKLIGYCEHPNSEYKTFLFRPIPPTGYVSLGDVVFTIQNNSLKWYDSEIIKNINIIFIKNEEKYCKPVSGTINTAIKEKEEYFAGVGYQTNCNIFKNNKQDNLSSLKSIKYKHNDLNYIVIGLKFQSNEINIDNQYGINKNYIQKIGPFSLESSLSNSYYGGPDSINQQYDVLLRSDFLLKDTPTYNNGRLLSYSIYLDSKCLFELYSTAIIFDRSGLNNDVFNQNEIVYEKGYKTYLNIADGLSSKYSITNNQITTKDGLDNWLNVPNTIKNIYLQTPLYLLIVDSVKSLCCRDQNLGLECGLGIKEINSNNTECLTFARDNCKADNKLFTTNFCQKDMCTTDYKNPNKLDCNEEYKAFCNKKDGNIYYNYYNYPDLCACFMDKSFLNGLCEDYRNILKISKKNTSALNTLGINTNPNASSDQCSINCMVNPMCRSGARIPYGLNKQRAGKSVVLGSNKNSSQGYNEQKCLDTNLCIQDVFVNSSNTAEIKDINIKQTNNCKSSLQRVCIEKSEKIDGNVTYGNCEFKEVKSDGSIIFTKKIIDDTTGQCGDIDTEFVCAILKNKIDTNCILSNDGKTKNRIITYNQEFKGASQKDVENALKDLIKNDEYYVENESKLFYNPMTKKATYINSCNDCEVGYTMENKCVLIDKNWKRKGKLNKEIKPAKNGGLPCVFNNEDIYLNCDENIDCNINLNYKEDKGCINGTKEYKYDIISYNSGEGKTCETVLKDNLTEDLKNLNPLIYMSNDKTKIIASISCEDCETAYIINKDINDGKCFLDESDGKYKIEKIGSIIKNSSGKGTCSSEKMSIVGERILEDCNQNQNCSFENEPYIDECDDNIGLRTRKYLLQYQTLGLGKTCEKIKTELFNTKFKDVQNMEIIDNELIVKSSCETYSDCIINWNTNIKNCDKKLGIQKEEYEISNLEKGRGKSCISIADEKYMYDKTYINSFIKDDKIIVYKVCSKETIADIIKSNYIYIIIIFTIIIIFIIKINK